MPGPRPLPTAIKQMRGNPGKRPLNDREPEAFPDKPTPSAILEGEALTEFHRLCTDLERMGTLSSTDVGAITIAAQLWEQWLIATREVKRTGQVVKASNGTLINSPSLNIANAALRDLRIYWSEFGMTPASRTKVKVVKKTGEEDRWAFLGRKQVL